MAMLPSTEVKLSEVYHNYKPPLFLFSISLDKYRSVDVGIAIYTEEKVVTTGFFFFFFFHRGSITLSPK